MIKGDQIAVTIQENRPIRGFVGKQQDAGTGVFETSDEMIEGLRLGYGGGGSLTGRLPLA